MTEQACTRTARFAALVTLIALSLAGGNAALAAGQDEYTGKLKDAWLDGRIETAFTLNRHLNPFTIDTKVDAGVVTLSGTVESDIDRDLAREIALSVDGVERVKNELQVASGSSTVDNVKANAREAAGTFLNVVEDATITATVKSRLVANRNTKGLKINVDTKDEVVTLSGTVDSAEERDLAGALARNSRNVAEVINELKVAKQ